MSPNIFTTCIWHHCGDYKQGTFLFFNRNMLVDLVSLIYNSDKEMPPVHAIAAISQIQSNLHATSRLYLSRTIVVKFIENYCDKTKGNCAVCDPQHDLVHSKLSKLMHFIH